MIPGVITVVGVLFLAHVGVTIRSESWSYGPHAGSLPRMNYQLCNHEEVGKFLKDRYACDKFFYCIGKNLAISVECPVGMVFNDRKEICDFPWNYHCVPEKRPEDVTTTEMVVTSTESTSHSPSATPTRSTIPISNPCPRDDTNNIVFLPDMSDCRRYYICYHGYPKAQECIRELHWNQRMKLCDFPENAQCAIASTTITSHVPAVITCPFRGEQIFPHPGECNYFIYCVNGYATVQQCPFFHYFDVQRRMCIWQTMAKCIIDI